MVSRFIFLCILPLSILAQNTLDEKGLKHGEWTKRHSNGKLRYVGMFKNDIPIGIFKHYDDKGNLTINLEYFNNGKSAAARLFHPNGTISAIGLYSLEKKDSLWKYFNEDEILVLEETYHSRVTNQINKH